MPRFVVACLALSLLAGPALGEEKAAPDAAAAPPRDRVREAVDAGNYFILKAFAARDAQAIADLYTEDGRVIAPGVEPVSGRDAIATFWENALKETAAVRLETLSVEPAGEGYAVEEGLAHLTAMDGTESTDRYLVVWKRSGRRWYLHRDIWNASPAHEAVPAAAPTPAPTPERAEPAMPERAEPAIPDRAEPTGPAGDEPFPGQEDPPQPPDDEPPVDEEPV